MKLASLLTALLFFAMVMTPPASAETTLFEGTIIAGETTPLFAPVGGVVEQLSVQPGELLKAGAAILGIGTGKVYAPISGKVIMPFAAAGDAVAALQTAHGAVLHIEPEFPYIAACTSNRAYQSNEMLTVYPGETVYLRSVSNETKRHTGEGIISQVSGGGYTITLHISDFKLNEEVRVYRTKDYNSQSCIGSGRIGRAENCAIQGNGVIAALHVLHGQVVKQGDLLFETVDATPTYGTTIPDAQLKVSEDCIVMAVIVTVGDKVAQEQLVAEVAPLSGLCIRMVVSEDELYLIQVGQTAQITLNAGPDTVLEGTITKISYLPESTTSGPAQYTVEIAFTADATMRIGMSATVSITTE